MDVSKLPPNFVKYRDIFCRLSDDHRRLVQFAETLWRLPGGTDAENERSYPTSTSTAKKSSKVARASTRSRHENCTADRRLGGSHPRHHANDPAKQEKVERGSSDEYAWIFCPKTQEWYHVPFDDIRRAAIRTANYNGEEPGEFEASPKEEPSRTGRKKSVTLDRNCYETKSDELANVCELKPKKTPKQCKQSCKEEECEEKGCKRWQREKESHEKAYRKFWQAKQYDEDQEVRHEPSDLNMRKEQQSPDKKVDKMKSREKNPAMRFCICCIPRNKTDSDSLVQTQAESPDTKKKTTKEKEKKERKVKKVKEKPDVKETKKKRKERVKKDSFDRVPTRKRWCEKLCCIKSDKSPTEPTKASSSKDSIVRSQDSLSVGTPQYSDYAMNAPITRKSSTDTKTEVLEQVSSFQNDSCSCSRTNLQPLENISELETCDEFDCSQLSDSQARPSSREESLHDPKKEIKASRSGLRKDIEVGGSCTRDACQVGSTTSQKSQADRAAKQQAQTGSASSRSSLRHEMDSNGSCKRTDCPVRSTTVQTSLTDCAAKQDVQTCTSSPRSWMPNEIECDGSCKRPDCQERSTIAPKPHTDMAAKQRARTCTSSPRSWMPNETECDGSCKKPECQERSTTSHSPLTDGAAKQRSRTCTSSPRSWMPNEMECDGSCKRPDCQERATTSRKPPNECAVKQRVETNSERSYNDTKCNTGSRDMAVVKANARWEASCQQRDKANSVPKSESSYRQKPCLKRQRIQCDCCPCFLHGEDAIDSHSEDYGGHFTKHKIKYNPTKFDDDVESHSEEYGGHFTKHKKSEVPISSMDDYLCPVKEHQISQISYRASSLPNMIPDRTQLGRSPDDRPKSYSESDKDHYHENRLPGSTETFELPSCSRYTCPYRKREQTPHDISTQQSSFSKPFKRSSTGEESVQCDVEKIMKRVSKCSGEAVGSCRPMKQVNSETSQSCSGYESRPRSPGPCCPCQNRSGYTEGNERPPSRTRSADPYCPIPGHSGNADDIQRPPRRPHSAGPCCPCQNHSGSPSRTRSVDPYCPIPGHSGYTDENQRLPSRTPSAERRCPMPGRCNAGDNQGPHRPHSAGPCCPCQNNSGYTDSNQRPPTGTRSAEPFCPIPGHSGFADENQVPQNRSHSAGPCCPCQNNNGYNDGSQRPPSRIRSADPYCPIPGDSGFADDNQGPPRRPQSAGPCCPCQNNSGYNDGNQRPPTRARSSEPSCPCQNNCGCAGMSQGHSSRVRSVRPRRRSHSYSGYESDIESGNQSARPMTNRRKMYRKSIYNPEHTEGRYNDGPNKTESFIKYYCSDCEIPDEVLKPWQKPCPYSKIVGQDCFDHKFKEILTAMAINEEAQPIEQKPKGEEAKRVSLEKEPKRQSKLEEALGHHGEDKRNCTCENEPVKRLCDYCFFMVV